MLPIDIENPYRLSRGSYIYIYIYTCIEFEASYNACWILLCWFIMIIWVLACNNTYRHDRHFVSVYCNSTILETDLIASKWFNTDLIQNLFIEIQRQENNSWYQPICEWQESFTLPYFLYFICRRHGEHFKRLAACCKTYTHYVGHFQDEYHWVIYCNIWMTKSFRIGNCECFLGLPYPILLVAGKRLKQSEGEI